MPYGKELESMISLLHDIIIRLDILLGICITGILIAIVVMLVSKFIRNK